MKILHIKVNGIVSDDIKSKIKENVKENLSEGLLITDETLTVEVLEVDDIGAEIINIDSHVIVGKINKQVTKQQKSHEAIERNF
ncbi:hypothetical protein [Pseudogracilibacillus auburnensis]|uniref:hypothetical protein n=1 Tax=Pseudogracilibacillus auburnensis TaxID=1494959 RepID=UPI001A95D881|nr:hypothetical protein [Pseudogracilibacillus auburnensis]MBO1003746.1 hypothetical protein [Pseudogracilibacillus auburnensis]